MYDMRPSQKPADYFLWDSKYYRLESKAMNHILPVKGISMEALTIWRLAAMCYMVGAIVSDFAEVTYTYGSWIYLTYWQWMLTTTFFILAFACHVHYYVNYKTGKPF
jgi:hypothetical protein